MRKDILIAVIISLALAIAILSLPDILEPVARSVLTYLGVYWAFAVFIIRSYSWSKTGRTHLAHNSVLWTYAE